MTKSPTTSTTTTSSTAMTPNDGSKKTRKKGYKEWTLQELSVYFDKPIRDVSEELDVSVTFIKKVCRRLKVNRWPFRKIQSIQKQMESCTHEGQPLISLPFNFMKQMKEEPYYFLDLLNKKTSIKKVVDELCTRFKLILNDPFLDNSKNVMGSDDDDEEEDSGTTIPPPQQQQQQQQIQSRSPYPPPVYPPQSATHPPPDYHLSSRFDPNVPVPVHKHHYNTSSHHRYSPYTTHHQSYSRHQYSGSSEDRMHYSSGGLHPPHAIYEHRLSPSHYTNPGVAAMKYDPQYGSPPTTGNYLQPPPTAIRIPSPQAQYPFANPPPPDYMSSHLDHYPGHRSIAKEIVTPIPPATIITSHATTSGPISNKQTSGSGFLPSFSEFCDTLK